MTQRWNILVLLFTVRLSMAFQFQSVASMSPAIMKTYDVGLSDIGLLISLYLAPGLAFALPGGEIGRRFGDKRVVLFGLSLMIAGGLLMAFAPIWDWQVAGRIVAGIGGVLLNVLMSKMVTDWFAGKEIATAMAIFVNSWPVGIALCLFVLPAIAVAKGIVTALLLTTAFCALGLVLLAALYRPPSQTGSAATVPAASWPHPPAIRAMIVAGSIWGLFNAAIGMVFGFGTTLLVERGWGLAAAGSATSLVLWIISLSVPFGGVLADRTGKHIVIMLIGFALFAVSAFDGDPYRRRDPGICRIGPRRWSLGRPYHEPTGPRPHSAGTSCRNGNLLHAVLRICRRRSHPRRYPLQLGSERRGRPSTSAPLWWCSAFQPICFSTD